MGKQRVGFQEFFGKEKVGRYKTHMQVDRVAHGHTHPL